MQQKHSSITMKTIGLKELREHTEKYVEYVRRGGSFLVMRRSEPIFKLSSPDDAEEFWEHVVDLTQVRRGGLAIEDLLSRL